MTHLEQRAKTIAEQCYGLSLSEDPATRQGDGFTIISFGNSHHLAVFKNTPPPEILEIAAPDQKDIKTRRNDAGIWILLKHHPISQS